LVLRPFRCDLRVDIHPYCDADTLTHTHAYRHMPTQTQHTNIQTQSQTHTCATIHTHTHTHTPRTYTVTHSQALTHMQCDTHSIAHGLSHAHTLPHTLTHTHQNLEFMSFCGRGKPRISFKSCSSVQLYCDGQVVLIGSVAHLMQIQPNVRRSGRPTLRDCGYWSAYIAKCHGLLPYKRDCARRSCGR